MPSDRKPSLFGCLLPLTLFGVGVLVGHLFAMVMGHAFTQSAAFAGLVAGVVGLLLLGLALRRGPEKQSDE